MLISYQSRRYALLNTPIEVDRHFRRVRDFLAPSPSDRILEIGCGRGFLTHQVRQIAPATVGVDVNPEAVANAVAPGLTVMDARQLAFDDAHFDKIYSFHVIEHILNLESALVEMDRVLKPGGRILLSRSAASTSFPRPFASTAIPFALAISTSIASRRACFAPCCARRASASRPARCTSSSRRSSSRC
jgi:ubiquinone/menaquinone biosynthesis C-methylase UbiE